MKRIPRLIGFLAAIFMIFGDLQPAHAVNPTEMLENDLLEKRARHISKEIRCVVCQNQSIDDSDAPLASDLRVLIRQRLVEGDTDREVIGYLVSRYGDFVLLTPPVKGATLFLWFGPIVFALLGMLGLVMYFRRQKALLKRGGTP